MKQNKETIMKWLRICSNEGGGECTGECPYVGCEDCSGALMKDAAAVLEDVACGKGGTEDAC